MQDAEFDRYVEEYDAMHRKSIAFSGASPDYFAKYKVAYAAKVAVGSRSIIDFGSGTGNAMLHFRSYFPDARLTCADVSERSLAHLRDKFGAAAQYASVVDGTIAAETDTFDLAFAACVFHHIAADEHLKWLSELLRVARPGATLIVFEHNPRNPLTRKAVQDCEFDVGVTLIGHGEMLGKVAASGWCGPQATHHVFFPEILRHFRRLEPLLGWLPLGGQYAVTARKPGRH